MYFCLVWSDCADQIKSVYTRWTSDAAVALKAPVTEVSFFTLTNGASEEAKTTIEDALKPILQAVKTVGKASGSAIGWCELILPCVRFEI